MTSERRFLPLGADFIEPSRRPLPRGSEELGVRGIRTLKVAHKSLPHLMLNFG
jgi:hypothetical protein